MLEGLFILLVLMVILLLVLLVRACVQGVFWFVRMIGLSGSDEPELEEETSVAAPLPASASASKIDKARDEAKVVRNHLQQLLRAGLLDRNVCRQVAAASEAYVSGLDAAATAQRTTAPGAIPQTATAYPPSPTVQTPLEAHPPKVLRARLVDEATGPATGTPTDGAKPLPLPDTLPDTLPASESPVTPTAPVTPHALGPLPAAPARSAQEPVTPEDRVRQFVQRRAAADGGETLEKTRTASGERTSAGGPMSADHRTSAGDRLEEPIPARPPAHPPAQPLSRLLAAFMEEKNIRWGELVGGLLIISGSIALVMSFWAAIAERPLLKFGVLNSVTASLFGVGIYASRRWRLPTTSQGILITALLLVPLNFLAIAAFGRSPSEVTLVGHLGEAFSIGLFAWLVFLASRIVTPTWHWSLTVGVIVPAVTQLAIRRFVDAGTPLSTVYGFSILLAGCFAGTQVWGLPETASSSRLQERIGNELFKRLGIGLFALLVSGALLLSKTERAAEMLPWLSPLSLLIAVPMLIPGALLGVRPGAESSSQRLAGASVCVAAMLLQLAALVSAWPQPILLVCQSFFAYTLLTLGAWRLKWAEAHAAAVLCAAAGLLLTVHVVLGELTWTVESYRILVDTLLSASTGRWLAGIAVVAAAVSVGIKQFAWDQPARWYGIASGIVALAGLALVVFYGFGIEGDPEYVVPMTAGYCALAAFSLRWFKSPWSVGAVGVLSLIALLQFLRYGGHEWSVPQVNALALVVNGLLMTTMLAGVTLAGDRWRQPLQPILIVWTSAVSLLAVVVMIGYAMLGQALVPAYLLAIALMWGLLAIAQAHSGWLLAARVAMISALLVAIDQRLALQTWYQAAEYPRIMPQSLQAFAMGLAVFATVETIFAAALRRYRPVAAVSLVKRSVVRVGELLDKQALDVDRIAIAGSLAVAVGLAVYSVIPGIGQELSLRTAAVRVVPAASDFWLADLPHDHAAGLGTWAVLSAIAVAIGVRRATESEWELKWGVVLLTAALPLLIAARWEADVAVASALRWSSAAVFAIVSVTAWLLRAGLSRENRGGTERSATHLAAGALGARVRGVAALSRRGPELAVWSLLIFAPLVAMTLFIVVQALGVVHLTDAQRQLWYGTSLMATAVLTVAGVAYIAAGKTKAWRSSPAAGWLTSAMILGAAPWVATTLFFISASLAKHPVIGPNSDSLFTRMGLAASYAIPLGVVAITSVGHAICIRSAPLAIVAGLLLNLSATAGYLLTQRVALLGWNEWMRLGQINAAASAMYALGWIAIRRAAGDATIDAEADAELAREAARPERETGLLADVADHQPALGRVAETLLGTQRILAYGFLAIALSLASFALFWGPTQAHALAAAGDWASWASFALIAAVVVLGAPRESRERRWLPGLALLYLALPILALNPWATASTIPNWMAYHLFQAGWFFATVFVIGMERLPSGTSSTRWLGLSDVEAPLTRTGWLGLLPLVSVIILSVFELFRDSGHITWTLLAISATIVLAIERGDRTRQERWWFAAMPLMCFAASFWFFKIGDNWFPARGAELNHFLRINLIGLSVLGIVLLFLQRRHGELVLRRRGLSIVLSTGLLLLIHGLLIYAGLMRDVAGGSFGRPHSLLVWTSVTVTTILLCANAWFDNRRWSMIACYLVSPLVLGTLLDSLNLPRTELLWAGTVMLAAHTVATSYVWSRRAELARTLQRLGRPAGASDDGHEWLVAVNSLLAIAVCVMGFLVSVTHENAAFRILVSQAMLSQSLAIGLLARGSRDIALRRLSLSIAVCGAVGLGWASLPVTTAWLNRLVVLAAALLAMAAFYAIGLIKLLRRENAWTTSAKELVPVLVGMGVCATIGVLVAEMGMYATTGRVDIAWPAIVAIVFALGLSCAACLVAAVVPGRDPFGWSESKRTIYVYAAEALLAVLCLHLRMTVPELFSGIVQRYWTLVVMAIAFLGVGLSEFFRRREQMVLATPLERTAMLLPLLPVLGLWIGPGDVHLSVAMLLSGSLYAALSIMRRSFGFGVLATIFANGSLWYFLHQSASIQFWVHPQVWLIPPAVCVLIAAYLNRQTLSTEQMTSIRYLASSVIYVSSTADVFLNGVASNPWLPIILAALSLAGMCAGIMLRVRGFLFMGFTFLVLSLFTVIWHAAVDLQQTWLWYVTAIIAGVLIIVLFAVFERKRQQVLGLVEQLKSWEG